MATTRDCTTPPVTSFIKDVRHNHETQDWDAYVIAGDEAIYLGSRDSSWDAAVLCDTYVYEQLMQQPSLDVAPDITSAPSTLTPPLPAASDPLARSTALQNCWRFSIPPFSNAPCLWTYTRMMRCCSS